MQKDTQLITAQAPPDMATMLAKKDVDAVIAWQPVSDLIVQRGDGVYLASRSTSGARPPAVPRASRCTCATW